MANEIELKFLEIDKKKVLAKLKSLKAKKTFEGKMEAIHFDYPDGRIKKGKSLLRLRTKGENAEFTFKKNVRNEKYKEKKEFEVITDDFKTLRQILGLMGFVETSHYTKHRQSFSVGDFHVEIDKYPDIPLFAELETKSRKSMKNAVKLMGLKIEDGKPWTRRDVLEYYSKM